MQDADLDSVNDGLSEALASIPAEPAPAEPAPEAAPESDGGQPRDPVTQRFMPKQKDGSEAEGSAAKPSDGEEREGGFVPSWRLREETAALRAERLEREAERKELEVMRRERAMWQQQQQRQREAEQAPQRPDPINDPDAYDAFIQQRIEQKTKWIEDQNRDRWVNLTMAAEHETHGELFDKAYAALQAQPEAVKLDVMEAINPGKALMKWHRKQVAITEVGDDIDGYNKRLRDKLKADPEFRKEFVAELDAEARGNSGRSSDNVTSLPSLNRAPGGGGRQTPGHLGDSDTEMYASLSAMDRQGRR